MARKKAKSNYIPQKKKKSGVEGSSVEGTLEVTQSGMGYVIVEGWDRDILVRTENLKNAIDGDKVKVNITKVSSQGRPEGKIAKVIEHKQEEFTGTLTVSEGFGFLVPDKSNIPFDIFIAARALKGGKSGDRAIARIKDWGNGKRNPEGVIVELLTNERENQIAMKQILLDAGFSLRFSEEAVAESEALPTELSEAEIAQRRDFRDVLTFTIDPEDAKDFDDAISFRVLENGHYEVGVHIADVSYYVQPDTELDKEAYQRATSVYLPDRVLPMLPENISNVLCSLRPNEDKFTFSAVFEMDEKGKVYEHWIGRTVIHSDHRFTYEEAQQTIETGEGIHSEVILKLDKMAKALRAARFKKGAINFSSQEIRFRLDEEGVPIGIVLKESKDAHKLIEEFMLLANRYVAQFVAKIKVNKADLPFPYRVHDVPNEEKLSVFAQFVARFGYKLNLNTPELIASSFNEMLAQVEGKPEQHVIEQLGIRTMAKAAYTTENIGHYGLGFEYYCHFTSPIRRYPDIMVHRVVQEVLDKEMQPDKKMELKCQHCSERERKAMEAERIADKYKQAEFMAKHIGDEFDALVSGVAPTGFWAETIEHKCEGMISIAELTEIDDFVFVDHDYALVGQGSGKRIAIGDKVKVRVDRVDMEKRQIDFGYVAEVIKESKPKKKKATKKKAKEE